MQEQSDRRRNLGWCLEARWRSGKDDSGTFGWEKVKNLRHGSCWCLRLMGAPVARQQLRLWACCTQVWGTYLWELARFLCVFHLKTESESVCAGWDGLSGAARQGRAVAGWKGACRHWLLCWQHIKGSALLWGALAPAAQALLKCKVELQILRLTAIKAALEFGWGFTCVFLQDLLG